MTESKESRSRLRRDPDVMFFSRSGHGGCKGVLTNPPPKALTSLFTDMPKLSQEGLVHLWMDPSIQTLLILLVFEDLRLVV